MGDEKAKSKQVATAIMADRRTDFEAVRVCEKAQAKTTCREEPRKQGSLRKITGWV